MSDQRPAPCGRPCWIQTILLLVCLAFMGWWALHDPLTPDIIDCRARGQADNCWERGR